MTLTTRLPGAARALTLIVALLTALALIPPAPATASIIKFVALDDVQPEFGAGARTLTSVVPSILSNDPIPGQVTEPYAGAKTGDQGALALSAVRALRWENSPASPLPAARTEIGAAVIGNTIWVVGGTGTGFNYVATVYRGAVNTNYGQPGAGVITWTESTPLPAVQHTGFPNPIAARTNAAVAARRTSGNAGNLYVIGGAVSTGLDTFSSDSVLVGDVDASGNLTWRSPSPPYRLPSGVRLEGARAFVHTTAAGKTFLYVVGGRNDPPGFPGPNMSNVVYYTEINPDGSLALGGDNRTWNSTVLPVVMGVQGVSDTAVTVGRYTNAAGTVTQDMFFIYGGRTNASNENVDTGVVRKGVINPATGAITWEDSSTGGGTATLPLNRNTHGAVEFNGSIYIIGGRNGGTINRDGYASYIDPTSLRIFKDGAINFYNDAFGALPSSAGNGRSNPGVVVVPTSNPNYAFAYLIGGAEGTSIRPEVFRATIGPSTDQTFYPATGYYYSKPFSMLDLINENQATVRKMTWLTNIDPASGGDIRLDYRVYSPSSGNCNDTEGGWVEVKDPDAGSGRFSKFNPTGAAYAVNAQEYAEDQRLPPGNCFQYRAAFTRGSVQNASPVLLRLGMEVIVPGNPDLNWPVDAVTVTQNADSTTRGIEVRLRNQNLIDPPTQPANVCHASQPGCNPEGTFFVDVFIFPPGVTPISPTLPLFAPGGDSLSNPALAPYHRACLQIPKNVMQKDVTHLIRETARWSDIQAVGIDGCASAATNFVTGRGKPLRDFLDQGSGVYKIILVADSHTDLKGLVIESDVANGDHPAERNNVSAIFDVNFVAGGAGPGDGDQEGVTRVFLPLVTR